MFDDFILTTPNHFALLQVIAPHAKLATTLCELSSGGNHLVAFSTGVIIPSDILSSFEWAYNSLGASPDYPGRDLYHWAAYDHAQTFGAVAHIMHASVDTGPIVSALMFVMPNDATLAIYRGRGAIALYALFEALAPAMFAKGLPPNGTEWSGEKHQRAYLLELCNMTGVTDEEVELRKFAFQGFEAMFSE